MIWYKNQDIKDDIIVSTRVRLARNLEKYPFPNVITKQDCEKMQDEVTESLKEKKTLFPDGIRSVKMSCMTMPERKVMVEKHLISSNLAKNNDASVIIDAKEEVSIMLMEEDHIRIQVIKSGFDLRKAYEKASMIDDAIEKECEYAYSEKYGYLTACPTNVGTGMRASVMMHLPALTMTGNMEKIIHSASLLGLTVRGLYGEGSKAYGSLYQISNQVTLGLSEEELLKKIENISMQIKKHEQEARETICKNVEVKDRLWRSLGNLRYARAVESKEAKALLSDYILGISTGIINEKPIENAIELMVITEPEHVCKIAAGASLSPGERDEKRAQILRDSI